MEKKILKELQNITKELKVIGKNTKKNKVYPLTKIEVPLDFNTEELNKELKKEDGKELVYDQEDAINYIRKNLREDHEAEITEGLLRAILELEENYMRSVGIIED